MPFVLRKWYFDCVTPRGDAFIGYWARLRWDIVRVRYASTLVAPAGGEARERLTFLPVAAPAPSPRGLRWRCRRLGLASAWHARAPAIERRLLGNASAESGAAWLDASEPGIAWDCLAPAATARVRVRGRTLSGLGYAERLTLTLEPWRLPFHTLHWGRFLARGGRSLVWILWESDDDDATASTRASPLPATPPGPVVRPPAAAGGSPGSACFVFVDSRPADVLEFAPDRLVTGEGAQLTLARERALRAGPVVSAPLRALPWLGPRVPPAFLAAREEKWLSRGTLVSPGAAPVAGWAIHEIVRFR